MKTSVIIPTYNGASKVLMALRSLQKLSVLPDEVIVVIDGSTDGTAALLQQERFELPALRIIEQANGGRAQVRNRGAFEASHELLVFLDDDMVVSADWLKGHLAHHHQHGGSILTGGVREPEERLSQDFYRFKSYLNDHWNKSLVASEGEAMKANSFFITAQNCSMLKSLFKTLGGFDERLRDAEDYDLAVRAFNSGVQMFFSSGAYAYHNEFANAATYVKRLRQYRLAEDALITLKPELYGDLHKQSVKLPQGLKGALFAFFAKKWWINSIDRRYWRWLPEKIRYKLYDVIITANGVYFPEAAIL